MLLQFVELFQAHLANQKEKFREKPQPFSSLVLDIYGEHSDLAPLN